MTRNDPTAGPSYRQGDDPWHPKAHAMSDRDKADPRDPPAIAMSRGLHESFCDALALFQGFAEKTSVRLCANLPKLQQALSIASYPLTADPCEMLDQNLSFQIATDTRLMSKILSALGALETLLKDDSLVSDPGLRRFGETYVQQPLTTLHALSRDDDISSLGSTTPVNSFEHRDASLKQIFTVHAEEIERLRRIPT